MRYKHEENYFTDYSIVDFASELNDLIRENKYLKERVKELELKDEQHQAWLNGMYNSQRETMGNVLSTLISNLDD